MADQKLTGLTAITSADNSDLLYIVDVTGNTPQKITVANLLAAVGAQSKVLLETIDNTATAGEFDFGPGQAGGVIATGYKRWIIEGELRGEVVATSDGTRIYFNADTTDANYHMQTNRAQNNAAVVTEGASSFFGNVPADSSPANSFAMFRLVIENPDGAVNLKQAMSFFTSYQDTDNIIMGSVGIVSAITAALTRVRLQTDNDPTDQLFGLLRMYGEN